MKITNAYIYRHTVEAENETIDTWGVAVVNGQEECVLYPDISVDREEAAAFARLLVRDAVLMQDLDSVACAYIEMLSCVSV